MRERELSASDNPLEAIASEHGLVPETAGISNAEIEQRLTLLQAEAASHILRTWSRDPDNLFTKVYEYMSFDTVKPKYSVAYVVRPRSARENACLCFSLMSKIPSQKLWAHDPDGSDLSRSVILDLQDMSEWDMSSSVSEWDMSSSVSDEQTVPEFPIEDDMQVQRPPVPRSELRSGCIVRCLWFIL